MTKFETLLIKYDQEFKKLGINYDKRLLTAVAKVCGPSLYSNDASKVAASDKRELERIKQNFLIKKLDLRDNKSLDDGIQDVIEQIGRSNRNKYRAMFYYLLTKRFRKSAKFDNVETQIYSFDNFMANKPLKKSNNKAIDTSDLNLKGHFNKIISEESNLLKRLSK